MTSAIIVTKPPSKASLAFLQAGVPRTSAAPRLVIRTDDKKISLTMPYAPQEFTKDNLAPRYQTVDRPGRPPLLLLSDPNLPTFSMTFNLGNQNRQHSAQPVIDGLTALAQSRAHVTLSFGAISAGLWRITKLTINGTDRTLGNEVSRATADVEFTRASDISVNIGPVSGGVKPKPAKAAPPKKPAPYVYTVKRGDTLWQISINHYGNPNHWRAIADYNHIPNPNLIYPGQKFILP